MTTAPSHPFLFYLVLIVAFFSVRTFLDRELTSGAAPDIHGTTIEGREFDLARFSGRPALIYFWATWCGICQSMDDSIDAVAKDHPVITIALRSGTAAQISAYLDATGVTMPVLLDEGGLISRRYGIRGVPATFVIGPDGDICFTTIGYTTEVGLRLRLWLAGIKN